ncbi:hypothetical protein SAMN05660816_05479 [Niastella yeongjuensis]|nr:hypothetical protein SAMN05660816_05479 [Niastella yeongjuensis]
MKTPKVIYTNGLSLTLNPNMKELPLSGSLARKLAEVNEGFAKSGYKSIEEMLKHARDSSPE